MPFRGVRRRRKAEERFEMSHRGQSDSHFAIAVGYLKFLEIIDDAWKQDSLSDDEVGPACHSP